MIAIQVTVQSQVAERFVAAVQEALDLDALDRLVDEVANRALVMLVEDTKDAIGVRADGRRWHFQKPENKWIVHKTQPLERVVSNPDPVMRYLDEGTADQGRGFIVPVRAKVLYIPLTRRGAAGWNETLVRGKDYILVKRVRGMTPRNIVAPVRTLAEKELLNLGRVMVRQAIQDAKAKAGL